MKKLLVLLVSVLVISCSSPVSVKDEPKKPSTPIVPSDPPGPVLPTYSPPQIDGATSKVLRAPSGYVSWSAFRGLIAQSDPLIGECTEEGTLYMFYSLGALVQYIPEDVSNYSLLATSGRLTVEAHNSVSPEYDQWDYIAVPIPAPVIVYDTSNDPSPAPLTVRYLDNSGNLAVNTIGQSFEFTFTLSEYQLYVYSDGSPKAILKLDFEAWGGTNTSNPTHMQLGGDGLTIPAATFHF